MMWAAKQRVPDPASGWALVQLCREVDDQAEVWRVDRRRWWLAQAIGYSERRVGRVVVDLMRAELIDEGRRGFIVAPNRTKRRTKRPGAGKEEFFLFSSESSDSPPISPPRGADVRHCTWCNPPHDWIADGDPPGAACPRIIRAFWERERARGAL